MRALIISLFLLLFFCSSSSFALFSSRICEEEDKYECYKVKRGDTWAKLFPDEEQQELVKKINRFANRLRPGMKIAIPHDIETASLLEYAPFKQQISPPGERIVMVSLNDMAWGAYEANGTLVHWGPTSSAKGYCPDIGRGCHTPTGTFTFYREGGAGCKSTKFPVGRGGAPMPYCMFFRGGFAMHGSYDLPGYNASHGCIRMMVPDAEWLSEFVEPGTPVIVRQSF